MVHFDRFLFDIFRSKHCSLSCKVVAVVVVVEFVKVDGAALADKGVASATDQVVVPFDA